MNSANQEDKSNQENSYHNLHQLTKINFFIQWRSGLLPVNNFGFSVDVFFSTFSSDCLSFLSAAVWWWQPNRRTKTRLAEVPLPHNILLWGSEPAHGMRVLCSITGRDLTLSEGKSLLAEVGGGGGTCTNWFSPTGRSHWGRDDNLRAESWDTGTPHHPHSHLHIFQKY